MMQASKCRPKAERLQSGKVDGEMSVVAPLVLPQCLVPPLILRLDVDTLCVLYCSSYHLGWAKVAEI